MPAKGVFKRKKDEKEGVREGEMMRLMRVFRRESEKERRGDEKRGKG